jgi:hypothetical protein
VTIRYVPVGSLDGDASGAGLRTSMSDRLSVIRGGEACSGAAAASGSIGLIPLFGDGIRTSLARSESPTLPRGGKRSLTRSGSWVQAIVSPVAYFPTGVR